MGILFFANFVGCAGYINLLEKNKCTAFGDTPECD